MCVMCVCVWCVCVCVCEVCVRCVSVCDVCDPLVLRGDVDFEVRFKTPGNHPKKRRVRTTLSRDLLILTETGRHTQTQYYHSN